MFNKLHINGPVYIAHNEVPLGLPKLTTIHTEDALVGTILGAESQTHWQKKVELNHRVKISLNKFCAINQNKSKGEKVKGKG